MKSKIRQIISLFSIALISMAAKYYILLGSAVLACMGLIAFVHTIARRNNTTHSVPVIDIGWVTLTVADGYFYDHFCISLIPKE